VLSHNRATTKTRMVKGPSSIPFDHRLLFAAEARFSPCIFTSTSGVVCYFHYLSGNFLANMPTEKPQLGITLGLINLFFLWSTFKAFTNQISVFLVQLNLLNTFGEAQKLKHESLYYNLFRQSVHNYTHQDDFGSRYLSNQWNYVPVMTKVCLQVRNYTTIASIA